MTPRRPTKSTGKKTSKQGPKTAAPETLAKKTRGKKPTGGSGRAKKVSTKSSKKKATAGTAETPLVDELAEIGERLLGVGGEAVRRATGKGWDEWLSILDEAGARAMDHPTIARLLNERHEVPGWWAQTLTVGYERARGKREVHQTSRGFEASRSRTIDAAVEDVFDAWTDERKRARWLDDPLVEIRTSKPGRSLRMPWIDGKTKVEVWLQPKGDSKTQVQVQHSKLANTSDVARKKAYWGEQLGRLKEQLEG